MSKGCMNNSLYLLALLSVISFFQKILHVDVLYVIAVTVIGWLCFNMYLYSIHACTNVLTQLGDGDTEELWRT